MPISIYVTFECPKCFYKKIKKVGDNISPLDIYVKCPVCGSIMKQTNSSIKKPSILDLIKIFK